MPISKFFLTLLITLSVLSVSAQKDYNKPIDKWSESDARGIVNESAWAKTYQSTSGQAGAEARTVAREQNQNVYSGGSNPRSVARDFGPPPVYLRLHSSEVLRKATVRLQQIAVGYDKMSVEDRAKYDASRKVFLDCAICKDYYVVTLTKAPYSASQSVDEGVFQTMTLNDMNGNVKLVNDLGEERELVQFTAPKSAGDSAVFFFKRTDANGKHLIAPESKEVRFVFANTFLDSRNRFAYLLPRSFDFKVSKMIVDGKVMF